MNKINCVNFKIPLTLKFIRKGIKFQLKNELLEHLCLLFQIDNSVSPININNAINLV